MLQAGRRQGGISIGSLRWFMDTLDYENRGDNIVYRVTIHDTWRTEQCRGHFDPNPAKATDGALRKALDLCDQSRQDDLTIVADYRVVVSGNNGSTQYSVEIVLNDGTCLRAAYSVEVLAIFVALYRYYEQLYNIDDSVSASGILRRILDNAPTD
jgi:hypothetical protein